MRIKKTSQTTPVQAEIVNTYSTSTEDGYSANYVNNLVQDVYSTDEVKTNKVWIDGKPVYQKVLTFETNVTAGNDVTTYNLNNNIDNLKRYISVNGFCYFDDYGSFKPIMAGITIDEVSNWSVALRDASSTKLTFNFGKSLSSAVEGIVILKYTKTTD